MGFWRDFAETVGLALPSGPLNEIGKTGIDCLDRSIDRAVRDDIRREELARRVAEQERKRNR